MRRRAALISVPVLLMLLGIALRAPVFSYRGPPVGLAITNYLMSHAGAYSDVAHLYVRDRLWTHPAPYLDYRFEYPVLTGAFVWLVGFVHFDLGAYFAVSALCLLGLGVLAVRTIDRIDGATAWAFAASPALLFYASLNWDLLGIALLAGALLLFQRGRDAPASALLALSVAAKLFPIAILPVVVALRLADGARRRALAIVAVFAAVTVAVDGPVAIAAPRGWSYFLRFTQSRPPKATIWKPLLGGASDVVSEPLFALGLTLITLLALRACGRTQTALMPAAAAALLWLFATAKVYSPQYALWVFAALAVAGAPLAAAIAFAAVDALVFTTTFGPLFPDFPLQVQWGAYGLRQLLVAALAVWIVATRLAPARGSPRPLAVAPAGQA